MGRGLGQRSGPIYATLRERIAAGELPAGAQLPSLTALAAKFQVTPVTIRQALGVLEAEGLVSCEQGRGCFVRATDPPAVLIVDDEPVVRAILSHHATRAGYRAIEATGPEAALAVLERDPTVALVLSDVRMSPTGESVGGTTRPETAVGVGFIRTVRQRYPTVYLAAVTGYPDDLAELHGTPEYPVLIVPKPFQAAQIERVLRLARPR